LRYANIPTQVDEFGKTVYKATKVKKYEKTSVGADEVKLARPDMQSFFEQTVVAPVIPKAPVGNLNKNKKLLKQQALSEYIEKAISPHQSYTAEQIDKIKKEMIAIQPNLEKNPQHKKLFENIFNKIKFAPLRPFIGGIIIALFIVVFNSTKFIGLGIPTIQDAFINNAGQFDFAIKLILTSFTLNAGFKGGEVTPLFFIGATLGNLLIWFIPLPMALLAGMGFVAVFSGATNCVFASIALGLELFGMKAGVYVGLASVAAYFTSGPNGIYSAKYKSGAKYIAYNYFKKIAKL
jgi:hypothetical protein